MDKSFVRGLGIGLVMVAVIDQLRRLPLIGGEMTLISVVLGIILLVWSFFR